MCIRDRASTSPFRRDLLQRLGLPFTTRSPEADESRLAGEEAPALVARLAELKARSVARHEPGALVIGSDQVALLAGEIIGKPGNHEQATAQLRRASARSVTFYTGLCPVSYTHLDVYKRQILGCATSACRNCWKVQPSGTTRACWMTRPATI